ncbi:cupin domain-containing protein [Photobacterium rosenbergii]|uniref:cupin domain-containing protein n=1 Tax=Photobacterium rosenbergii TaxID=294936 RepID=UPI001C9974B3|nr:cupin domain-containing protein [Photobacterium rosenbergii]MBY5944312.1 cupin domain-containing protein [Photobacterium rosenbergii]
MNIRTTFPKPLLLLVLLTLTLLLSSFSLSAATSKDLIKTTSSWNGELLPSIQLQQPEITIKEITVEPGEKLPWHQHPVINTGILLSGQLIVHTQDKKVTLNAGEVLVEVMNTSHYGENTGDEPAKVIVFYIAEKDSKVTILDQ